MSATFSTKASFDPYPPPKTVSIFSPFSAQTFTLPAPLRTLLHSVCLRHIFIAFSHSILLAALAHAQSVWWAAHTLPLRSAHSVHSFQLLQIHRFLTLLLVLATLRSASHPFAPLRTPFELLRNLTHPYAPPHFTLSSGFVRLTRSARLGSAPPRSAPLRPAPPRVQVFKEYFGELEEESIRDNFVIIYELLDEMMDFGYPQSTEHKILQAFITQEGNRLEAQPKPPAELTNTVSWRGEGIKHRKNEIFLDVIEKLNLLVGSNGNVLHSEILGAVKMKSFLSGMPELKLGLNDKLTFEATGRPFSKGKAVEMEDIKFHQCVRLARFENDRTISFIPPDGEFELMSYRLNTQVKPLIWVEAVVEPHSHSRIEYMIKAKSHYKSRSIANNDEIIIPVPNDVDSPSFKASIGTVTYVPDKDAIIWSIKQFYGSREYLMRAHFGLPSTSGDAETENWKSPIGVKFEIPYFTVSGIQVRPV